MACRLLIKNIQNAHNTGDVIYVELGSKEFGLHESKAKFEESGLIGWPRHFVIVNVIDADKSDYDYLLEVDGDGKKTHYIQPQGKESPFYQELLDKAEVTVNKVILESLIMARAE